jgi:beta-lactamase class A
MSRILAAVAVIAALVLFSKSGLPQSPPMTRSPEAPAAPAPAAFEQPPPDTEALPDEEPQAAPDGAETPEVVIESYAEAAEPPADEPEAAAGDEAPPSRAAPAAVFSYDELQIRIDELLDALPGRAGVAILRDGQAVFVRDEGHPYRLASVAKLFILAAYLDRLSAEQRPPDDWEYGLLESMIAYSDNDAAEYFWEVLGGNQAVQAFLNSRGFFDFRPAEDDSWGDGADTPTEVAAFLTRLTDGSLLDPDSTTLALRLLGEVTEAQRWGVTAGVAMEDPDATVLLKDGWYPDDDGWLVNSAGLVTPSSGSTPYAIVVLGEGFPSYDEGLEVVNDMAAMANGLLLRPAALDPSALAENAALPWEWRTLDP